jgi:CHAT domain-containing protein
VTREPERKSGGVSSYPIVARFELSEPGRRGPLGLIKRRDNSGIPAIKAHEVLVWRVGGRYVVDSGKLRARNDTVVRASSVSIVSIRPGTEVEVSFQVDSADALEFSVKVTFLCSVLDPAVVVRDEQVNVADALLAYLRRDRDLFYLGLNHRVEEIAEVRAKVATQIHAYTTLRPLKIPGMEIALASVQLWTPAEVPDFGGLREHRMIARLEQQREVLNDAELQDRIREKLAELAETIDAETQAAIQRREEAAIQRREEFESREARQRLHREVQAQIDLLRLFAERGYLDATHEDIGELISRLGAPGQLVPEHVQDSGEEFPVDADRQAPGRYNVAVRDSRGVQVGDAGTVVNTFGDSGSSGTGLPDPGRGGGDSPDKRYLLGQCPEVVPVGRPFSLVASIVRASTSGASPLLLFPVPSEGQDVLLVLHAPRLRLLGDQRLTVHVPAVGDSNPVMFELRADEEGPRSISITAWLGGSYLGELVVEVTAGQADGRHREFRAEIGSESSDGAVSLVVRYDPELKAYRFEFRDEDNPNEVVSRLSFEPRQRIERLLSDLSRLAAGRSGYSPDQTRDYLVNAGAELWSELVPLGLREQFWERQHRIRQLTILADRDTVPWELLYPRAPGHDAGFLVQQFPVTRGIFGRRPAASLSLWPARFVLPRGSLPEAEAEIDVMRRLLDPSQEPDGVIADLTPLQDLIRAGDFGLLHFACHNRFEPDDDASIKLGGVQFTPRFMTTAVIDKVLARSAPTVFMNACRSAGLAPTYNRLDGWASKFLEAGAGAFIGSLWAVSDGAAREFAEELYGQLKTGASLGKALMDARSRAATHADDPTWLAYSAYGDPRAKVARLAPTEKREGKP